MSMIIKSNLLPVEHLSREMRLDSGMILLPLRDPGVIVHFEDIRLKDTEDDDG